MQKRINFRHALVHFRQGPTTPSSVFQVFAINTLSPFIINARLKPLMLRAKVTIGVATFFINLVGGKLCMLSTNLVIVAIEYLIICSEKSICYGIIYIILILYKIYRRGALLHVHMHAPTSPTTRSPRGSSSMCRQWKGSSIAIKPQRIRIPTYVTRSFIAILFSFSTSLL